MRTKHIIQTTLRMAAFAAVFILAVSCTSDMFDQRPNGTGSDSKYAVSFSLGNRHVQTRGTRAAADVSGYERETAITLDNTHHMYAVIFNASDKKWFKTVEINSSDYSNGTFTFDMGQGGDYYMYLVANTVETTKLTDLTAETTEDDFFQIIDETPISDAGIGTTDFLMVSGRQHVNIDLDVTQGPTTTDLDAVLVYRRATRIDIDGSGVTGLQIKKVVMNKRYKDASYLVRADNNNAPAVAPSASGDGYVTTTYQLNGTATTNLIAVTATEQNATGAKVDDDEWQGVIYCYENPTENDTELEITCTIGNVERTTVVPFGTTPVKANTLYTVQLSVEETPTSTAGELSGSITVKDWENVTLTYANLTDTQVPNFTVVSGATASGTNPAAMRVVRRADSDVILEVTSTGVYGSEVAFLNRTGASFNFSAGGGTITRSSTVTYNESGQIVETFTIHIPSAMAVGLTSSDYLTFAVSNAYNSDSKRTFTITSIPKLPIQYVASYNMASATAFAANNNASSSMYFSWNNSTAVTNGVGTVAWTSAKSDIQAFITGTAVPGYHLPSKAEWCSIIAPYHTQNNGTGNIDSDMWGTNGDRITYKNGQHLGLQETVAWGVTNASGTYTYEVNQVFYNDYNCPNDAAHETIGYGLRFKEDASTNGDYTCAYRYEYKASDPAVGGGASLTVKVIYVGADPSVTIATISDESWWASPDYTLVLPACGYSDYTNGSNQNPGYYSSATSPAGGYYWSATPRDESRVWNMFFHPLNVYGNFWNQPGYGFSVRLFRDGDNSVTPIPTDPGVDFADVTSTHKGWYIAKNGKAYQTMALANQYSTAVGYICYTGAVSKYFDKFIAIALHDAHTTNTTWSDALSKVNTFAGNNAITVGSTTYNTNAPGTSTYYDQVTDGTGTSSASRTGSIVKGWRLPSVTDWRYIFQGLGGPSATNRAGVGAGSSNKYGTGSTLLSAINTACGNTELQSNGYWSSSEVSSSSGDAWLYFFNFSCFSNINKTNSGYVRAVFAY